MDRPLSLPGARLTPLRGSRSSPWIYRYGVPSFCVAVALASTILVQRFFPYPFLFLFFAAVVVSAWFGGTTAGLFAVLLSTLAVDYFFVPPFYSFAVNATEMAYFIAFVLCAFVASGISSFKRNNEQELKEARDRLEIRVADLTGNSVQNATLNPMNFQMLYAGTGSVSLKGNSQASGLLYAPLATFSFGGGADWYGAVIGASLTDMGGAAIHYDRRLGGTAYTISNYMLDSFTWQKY